MSAFSEKFASKTRATHLLNFNPTHTKTAPYRTAILFSFKLKSDVSNTLGQEEKQAFSHGAARSSSFRLKAEPCLTLIVLRTQMLREKGVCPWSGNSSTLIILRVQIRDGNIDAIWEWSMIFWS